jgi:uncharacterized membrane protein YgdD (TMEM256/DUF423 family)
MKSKFTLLAGGILGGLGVALGAFGAHALKPMLEASGRLETYELAVRYQFYHALALLFVGLFSQTITVKFINLTSSMLLTGTILFSGSLYLLCLTEVKSFALITPFGGVVLLTGWALLVYGIIRHK